MCKPWQLIPRYHPQIGPLTVFQAKSCASKAIDLRGPLKNSQAKEGEGLFSFARATGALYTALIALKLTARSKVAVPAYSCALVFEAIRAAGYECLFIDSDPMTMGMDIEHLARQRCKFSAIVVINTFGFSPDIDKIRNLVGDVPIIEDGAVSFGSSCSTKVTDTKADATVLSFGLNKPLSSGGGGVLLVNNPRLLPTVQHIVENISKPARLSWIPLFEISLRTLLYRVPWYGFVVMWLGASRATSETEISCVDMGRIDDIYKCLIQHQIKMMGDRFARQRTWGRKLAQALKEPVPSNRFLEDDNWNAYVFPIIFESHERREQARVLFRSRGIDAFVLWENCLSLASAYGYKPGSCPILEDVLGRLLVLPSYAELTTSQKNRILTAVQELISST